MQSRRKFLQNTALLGVGSALSNPLLAENKLQIEKDRPFPIVIATWNNEKAVKAAYQVIKSGGRAVDAVEMGAKVPEADPNDTSVGYGGFPDRDGHVTLDACIMDEFGNAGSVMFLEDIMHPISVARMVMEKTPHVFLAGEGAQHFALENGFEKQNLLTDKAKQALEEWRKTSQYQPKINVERHDTIGILAADSNGNFGGACSTSGLAFKMRGRVGDSPIIGAGLYVDNEVGAATATGLGEAVVKKVGAFSIVEMMRNGKSPQQACEEAIKRLQNLKNIQDLQVGYIAVSKKGEIGAFSVHPGFQYAVVQKGKFRLVDSKSLFSEKK